MVKGTQFSGLTNGAAYGDDFQDSTNYALVRITNTATKHVVYAKTTNPSTSRFRPAPRLNRPISLCQPALRLAPALWKWSPTGSLRPRPQ